MLAGKQQLIFNLWKLERQWKKSCSLLAQGRVLQDSLFGCGGCGFSHSPAAAETAGLAALTLPSSLNVFPDPPSQEMEDSFLKVTSKGLSYQLLLPIFHCWYATSCLERVEHSRLDWDQKNLRNCPVPLEIWHHLSQGAAGSHTPCNCLRRKRRGEGTFFFVADWVQVYSGW